MTKDAHMPRSGPSLGRRLAELRRERGFATARALAQELEGSGISEAVIQNIEAGRKPDITVSQLLNLSMALRTSPLFLLSAYGRPLDALDLPNLSAAVSALTNADLDAWISGRRELRRGASLDESSDVIALDVFRQLVVAMELYVTLGERLDYVRMADPESPETEALTDARRRVWTDIAILRARAYGTDSWLGDASWSVDGLEDG